MINHRSGITIIEVIIYLGVVTIIGTAMTQFMFNLFSIRSKTTVMQQVSHNLRLVSNKLSNDIRQARSINSLSTNSLNLAMVDTNRNPTVYNLTGNRIYYGFGVGGSCPYTSPCPLTDNLVGITEFSLTNLSTGDSKSQNVRFNITGEYLNPGSRSEFNYQSTITGSSEIRSK